MRKARIKFRYCPGCGVEGHDPGTLCGDCRPAIKRQKDQTGRNVELYCVSGLALVPVYLSVGGVDGSDIRRKLADVFVRMLAGKEAGSIDPQGRYLSVAAKNYIPQSTGDNHPGRWERYIELTADQAAAARRFAKYVRYIIQVAYKDGLVSGTDMLGRLARGDTTVHNFDEYEEKAREYKIDPFDEGEDT